MINFVCYRSNLILVLIAQVEASTNILASHRRFPKDINLIKHIVKVMQAVHCYKAASDWLYS